MTFVFFQMTEYLESLRIESRSISSEIAEKAVSPIKDLLLEEVLDQVSDSMDLTPLTSNLCTGNFCLC